MTKVVIDGISLSCMPKLTGVQRYGVEVITRLDDLLFVNPEIRMEYAYLRGAENRILPLDKLKNIKPVEINSSGQRKANLYSLPNYIKDNKAVGICFSPELLRSKEHISCIHDIRPVQCREYDTKRFQILYRLKLGLIRKYASKIVTVSNYQNKVLREYLKIKNINQVITIYNGWEHMDKITPDDSIFEKFPLLEKGCYFYALGSLAPHKNFKWIIEIAKRNSEKQFAIAGGKDLRAWRDNIETNKLKNVIFLGYVSDAENKALMQSCKAFLHPSKYEGFGIPPLEALSCGASVAVANATCLPEVYEDCVHYFDPDDYEIDLEKLLNEPVASSQKILKKCSWEKSAAQWLDLIKERISQ